MGAPYRVFVVLDGEYGERLLAVVQTGPVWIVDTPTNRAAAQKVWSERPHSSHLDSVTTFTPYGDSPEAVLISELDMIDLHHGIHSADPPYTVLEIIGTSVTEKIKGELAEYGFNEFSRTDAGFRAVRPLPSSDDPSR